MIDLDELRKDKVDMGTKYYGKCTEYFSESFILHDLQGYSVICCQVMNLNICFNMVLIVTM